MRLFLGILFAALIGVASAAQIPKVRPKPRPVPLTGMELAMAEMRSGAWGDALDAAEEAGPVARDVIEWHRLRAGRGTFDEVLDFLDRNGDWPGLPLLRQRSEESVPQGSRAGDVLRFFDGYSPRTGDGAVALVRAHAATGAEGDAQAQAALAWLELPMAASAEEVLLSLYPEVLAPLHAARLDAMLWQGASGAAERAMERVGDDLAALARARLGLAEEGEVPAALRDAAGLAHREFRRLMRADDHDAAVTLLLRRSVSPEALGRPDRWANDRRDLARRSMRSGEPKIAYAIASSHWLTEGSDFADLEWLSGYLALTYLDQPRRALSHFKRFRAAVETPISLGRAGYWTGRAHEALGNGDLAQEAYARGAEYQTSFYGLLAAERAGLPLDPALTGEEEFPPLAESDFADSNVLKAALVLQAAGEQTLAARFMRHLGESLDRAEQGTLGELALSLGEPYIALMVAKGAARQGLTIPRPYFPMIDLGVANMPVAPELALAIARRESEFRAGAASGAGARGLMQLMPGTARDVALSLDLPFSAKRLFTDPKYNATLGTAYLAGLIERFGDNPILVAAGYNAGPGRPIRWIREFGDPRGAGTDMIDWIEHIPFDETRNYVMRVAESLPVYRARLTGETGPLNFRDEIEGR